MLGGLVMAHMKPWHCLIDSRVVGQQCDEDQKRIRLITERLRRKQAQLNKSSMSCASSYKLFNHPSGATDADALHGTEPAEPAVPAVPAASPVAHMEAVCEFTGGDGIWNTKLDAQSSLTPWNSGLGHRQVLLCKALKCRDPGLDPASLPLGVFVFCSCITRWSSARIVRRDDAYCRNNARLKAP